MDRIENNIGKIEISKELLKHHTGIFSKINPLHIEEERHGILIFTCVSEYFDEVKEGDRIPFYEVQLVRHGPHIDTKFIKTDTRL